MARGDPIFARVDISLLFDPRIRRLTASQKWFYMAAYLTSVEARSELLPPRYDLDAIRDRAGVDPKTGRKCLEKSFEVGLMEQTPEGLLKVIGTRANNPKLKWNEYDPDSPYPPHTGQDKKKEKTEIKERNDREESKGGSSATSASLLAVEGTATQPSQQIKKLSHSFSPSQPSDTSDPPKEPEAETTQRNLDSLLNSPMFNNRLADVVKFALGNNGSGNAVIEAAYKHPDKETLIRECAAYAGAWRQTNPGHQDQAPGVFINKLKERIGFSQ